MFTLGGVGYKFSKSEKNLVTHKERNMVGQPATDNWDKWLIPKVCYTVKVKVSQGYIARIT